MSRNKKSRKAGKSAGEKGDRASSYEKKLVRAEKRRRTRRRWKGGSSHSGENSMRSTAKREDVQGKERESPTGYKKEFRVGKEGGTS